MQVMKLTSTEPQLDPKHAPSCKFLILRSRTQLAETTGASDAWNVDLKGQSILLVSQRWCEVGAYLLLLLLLLPRRIIFPALLSKREPPHIRTQKLCTS